MSNPMKVPLLDLKAQYASLKQELVAALLSVAESQAFIMGPDVKQFEEEVAQYCAIPHAISCASGSDALLLALMALEVKAGDEVICPSYTFFATAGAISRVGAVPVFADIDPATYNVSAATIRKALTRCTRLKAIIPVHLYGQSVDTPAIKEIADELKVPVIEDAAQAIGSQDVHGNMAGQIGAVGCFSFFPSKNLGGFGDGGLVATCSSDLAEKLRILRVHGSKPKYYHKVIGINSRLDTIQAAILSVKLKYLDLWTKSRQRNATMYDELFGAAGAQDSGVHLKQGALPLRTPLKPTGRARHIYNQYVVRVPASIRDNVREQLQKSGIATEVYYPVPLHLQDCFSMLGYKPGTLPESESAAQETIALPIYPELTQVQIQYVAETVVSILKSSAR